MKLYTIVVLALTMCMTEDNHGPNYFKGDDQQSGQGTSVCDLTHCSIFHATNVI